MSALRRGARSCTARTITATDARRRLSAAGRALAFLAATATKPRRRWLAAGRTLPLLLAAALLLASGGAATAVTGKAGVETADALETAEKALKKAGGEAEEAGSESARLYQAVADITDALLPPLNALQAECGADVLCAATRLAEALAPHARLQQVTTPSTDAIRGVEKRASLQDGGKNAEGWAIARLHRFGRDALWEMRDFLAAARESGAPGVIVDVRGNGGGDFDRMLRIAALFCPPQSAEVLLRHDASTRRFSLPSDALAWGDGVRVWIDRETASSAEILAALLRRCIEAPLLGERTAGKNILLREIAVRHGWRLLVPAGRLEVPGVSLTHGLQPDSP